MSAAVHVEVVHHAGCPLFDAVVDLVRECVVESGVDAVVSVRVARYPSPSVLVDGRDVMGIPGEGTPADACRLDAPTRERVAAALRAATSAAC